jgi:class 3 adenylate cyclase
VASPRTQYARSGELDIAYQVVGEGPLDLVVVPPGFSVMEPSWDWPALGAFWRRLARFARVVLIDKRGTGLSDRVSGVPTVEDRMDDVRAVMDAIGSPRAALLGGSEAGPITTVFAATYPERTVALVLIAAMVKWSATDDLPDATGNYEAEILEYLTTSWGSGLSGELLFAPSLPSDERTHQIVGRFESMAGSPRAIQRLLEMNREIDIRAVLPVVNVPTLIVHRRGDRVVSIEQGRYFAQRIHGAKYVELDGEDHWWWTGEQPDDIPREIEEFLTGHRPAVETDRVLKTVLFSDIVDSTRRAAELGDRQWRELLDRHDAMVRAALDRYDGQEIKTTGDGFLVAFDGPARAIRCAQTITDEAPAIGLAVRTGLHTGECERRGDDLAGIAVHIAARVAARAGAGEVLVTSTVRDLVAGSDFRFEDRGRHELKGVPDERQLLAVSR